MSKASELGFKWYEWPLMIAIAPFILGVLWYVNWSGRRWNEKMKLQNERWMRERGLK